MARMVRRGEGDVEGEGTRRRRNRGRRRRGVPAFPVRAVKQSMSVWLRRALFSLQLGSETHLEDTRRRRAHAKPSKIPSPSSSVPLLSVPPSFSAICFSSHSPPLLPSSRSHRAARPSPTSARRQPQTHPASQGVLKVDRQSFAEVRRGRGTEGQSDRARGSGHSPESTKQEGGRADLVKPQCKGQAEADFEQK
jgi:hypothetical protein